MSLGTPLAAGSKVRPAVRIAATVKRQALAMLVEFACTRHRGADCV